MGARGASPIYPISRLVNGMAMGDAVGSPSICSCWLPPSLNGISSGVTGGVMPGGLIGSSGVIPWGVNIGVVGVGTTEPGTETFSAANRMFNSGRRYPLVVHPDGVEPLKIK